MNTKDIQPKAIFTENGEKSATLLSLTNFYDYHFDNGGGNVNYRFLGMESPGSQIDENGNEIDLAETAVIYFKGTIGIPSEIIQQWGQSDEIIWNYVCNQLQITLI